MKEANYIWSGITGLKCEYSNIIKAFVIRLVELPLWKSSFAKEDTSNSKSNLLCNFFIFKFS